MTIRHWIVGIVLLALIGAAGVGVLRTRPEAPPETEEAAAGKPAGNSLLNKAKPKARRTLVDQSPLLTARKLAALAATPEEQAIAHAAEKAGDHEVDLAFFDRLRDAEETPPKLSPEAKLLADRKQKAQNTLAEDQEGLTQLKRKLAAAPAAQKDNLQDQIDVAQAQVELDQDEVDDAAEDLEQAGGDPQAKLKHLKAEHDASDHNDVQAGSAADPHERDYQSHTLYNVFRAWRAWRAKKWLVVDAQQETATKQERLKKRHDTFAAKVAHETEELESARQQAKGFSSGSTPTDRIQSQAGAASALMSLKQVTHDQRNLADLARRMQDEKELNDLYGNWITLIEARERAALHNIFESLLWILLVALAVYLISRVVDQLIDRLFRGTNTESKRIETMHSVTKLAVQAAGLIVVLLMILGMPTQTATILGFVGAGLTVALKDFIVPFFGWFVLIGGNGLRVGDWVEINGVAGEVVEIGLLRTVLMETGNWTDAGHPTGRKVAFPNSFAIEGHFFNFSTSSQWMWDELQLEIPANQDPYGVIDNLQKVVAKETEASAKEAGDEWGRATTRYRVKSFSAEPAINVRPTGSGVEVRVRYITRAHERHETRKRLNEAVVELMHGKREVVKQ